MYMNVTMWHPISVDVASWNNFWYFFKRLCTWLIYCTVVNIIIFVYFGGLRKDGVQGARTHNKWRQRKIQLHERKLSIKLIQYYNLSKIYKQFYRKKRYFYVPMAYILIQRAQKHHNLIENPSKWPILNSRVPTVEAICKNLPKRYKKSARNPSYFVWNPSYFV